MKCIYVFYETCSIKRLIYDTLLISPSPVLSNCYQVELPCLRTSITKRHTIGTIQNKYSYVNELKTRRERNTASFVQRSVLRKG